MVRTRTAVVAAGLLGSAVLMVAPASAAGAGHQTGTAAGPRPAAIAAARPGAPLPVSAGHGSTPAITGDDATLIGDTCTSPSNCFTAGFFVAGSGSTFGLSEVWNGHSWGTITVSGLPIKDAVTTAFEVSCGAPGSCMIVGEHYNNPRLPVQFADTLNTDWTPVKWNNPPGARWSVLDDVKCVGTTFCMAIGIFSKTSGGGRVLAELWNGQTWRQLSPPNPARLHGDDLSALYCESVTDCQAVGLGRNSAGRFVTFTEHWNGSKWTLGSLPQVPGRNNELSDVACFAPGDCVAVGLSAASGTLHPLVLRLHGGKWHIVSTPALRGAALTGISCPSATLCVAVGFHGRRPLSEKWNGQKWVVLTTARTSGSRPDDQLLHVACTSVSHCVAVGFRYNATRRFSNHTLIEAWNGVSWSIQTSVNP